jgi:hypothetical protein
MITPKKDRREKKQKKVDKKGTEKQRPAKWSEAERSGKNLVSRSTTVPARDLASSDEDPER